MVFVTIDGGPECQWERNQLESVFIPYFPAKGYHSSYDAVPELGGLCLLFSERAVSRLEYLEQLVLRPLLSALRFNATLRQADVYRLGRMVYLVWPESWASYAFNVTVPCLHSFNPSCLYSV